MKNPVNRFGACKYEYNRSLWLSTTDDIHICVTGCWWTPVNNFVHRQYMDLVLCGTAARRATISRIALLLLVVWFGESRSRIHLYFTSICISWRNEKVTRVIISINRTKKKHNQRCRDGVKPWDCCITGGTEVTKQFFSLLLINPCTVFPTFNLDQLAKICKHG